MAKFGSNYVFNRAVDLPHETNDTATMKGVGIKTILLLAITIITGLISVTMIKVDEVSTFGIVIAGYALSPIITLILSLIMSFKPTSAKVLAIPYAVFEGLGIGSLAVLLILALGIAEAGLILGLALLITVAIFMGGAILYTSGLIRVTTRFRKFMYILLLGFVLSSIIIGIIGIFNSSVTTLFYGNTMLSLIIAIVMVIVASIYTVISLDNATRIVDSGLDKNYEWYASFGIVLNIIWLFYEVVRLLLLILSKSRD